MSNKVVTLRLVDGSVHETVLDFTDIADAKADVEKSITGNLLIRVKHPRYGEVFGEEYILGKHVIAFRISDDSE